MKFALAVVLLALALGAQAAVLPLGIVAGHGLHGLGYTAVSGVLGAPTILSAGPLLTHGHVLGHTAVVAAAPAAVIAPIQHEGTYVAKTRGAVHTAPLAGHANSAASINLLPAPGTV